MCRQFTSLSLLGILLISTAPAVMAQTYSTGSQPHTSSHASQGSTATYQRGSGTAGQALSDLTPDQIFLDVEKSINPQTGETEFIAPTFDPFEQDDDLAASVNLRSTGEVRDLNNDPMSDGALVEISLYYTDFGGDRDFSRMREALFLNGEIVPIILRDSRELECSSKVTETIYRSDRYYSPHYGGLYRSPPIYLGFSFGGHGWHRDRRRHWNHYRPRYFGPGYPYAGRDHFRRHQWDRERRWNDRRQDFYQDRDRNRNRQGDRNRNNDRTRGDGRRVTPTPTPRHIERDWGDGQDRRYQQRERFRNNPDQGRRPGRRDTARSSGGDSRAESRTRNNRPRSETVRDRRAEPPRRQQATPPPRPAARANTPGRVNPPARVRPQPPARTEPRPQPRSEPRSQPRPQRAQPQPRRADPPPRRPRAAPLERQPDTLNPRLEMFPDGYRDTVVVSSQRDCAREDRLTLFIPEERLEAARFDGLTLILRDIAINQRTGQVTVYDERPLYIPANYIEGFRMAVANP